MLLQGVQNLMNMLQVFGPSLVVNENIIQIHHYKSIGEWSQDIVCHPTTTKVLVNGLKISFVILMKVDGLFFKPKGMTNHSK